MGPRPAASPMAVAGTELACGSRDSPLGAEGAIDTLWRDPRVSFYPISISHTEDFREYRYYYFGRRPGRAAYYGARSNRRTGYYGGRGRRWFARRSWGSS